MNALGLQDGSRVAIIGGGPAGSFCAYFLLTLSQALAVDLAVDIYEPRDFDAPGPAGCNMCGGVVSESLIGSLARDGIILPPAVVQRIISSYVLTTDEGSVRITMAAPDKHVAALHRGAGPRGVAGTRWQGLDGYLLRRAAGLGAEVIRERVAVAARQGSRPTITVHGRRRAYDLVVGATGVNSTAWALYEQLGIPSPRPRTTRAYIFELPLDRDEIARCAGEAMHIFLLRIARLEFAAIIPKETVLTVCLLGRAIDRAMIEAFFASTPVRRIFGGHLSSHPAVCRCMPAINVGAAPHPYADGVVLVGDCGVTRLYKDGIGAAYRTAKAAALTAMFSGVSAESFRRYYLPVYRAVEGDNSFGRLLFFGARQFKACRPLLRGLSMLVAREQTARGAHQPISHVLWGLFTGSAPYRDIFVRAIDPRLLRLLFRETLRTAFRSAPPISARAPGTGH